MNGVWPGDERGHRPSTPVGRRLAEALRQNRAAVHAASEPDEPLALIRFALILAVRERLGSQPSMAEVTSCARELYDQGCEGIQARGPLELEAVIRATYGEMRAITHIPTEVFMGVVSDLTYLIGREVFASPDRIDEWVAQAEHNHEKGGPVAMRLAEHHLGESP